jgi:hypothetical protein
MDVREPCVQALERCWGTIGGVSRYLALAKTGENRGLYFPEACLYIYTGNPRGTVGHQGRNRACRTTRSIQLR